MRLRLSRSTVAGSIIVILLVCVLAACGTDQFTADCTRRVATLDLAVPRATWLSRCEHQLRAAARCEPNVGVAFLPLDAPPRCSGRAVRP